MMHAMINVPWGGAQAPADYRCETPVFRLAHPVLTRERSYDRALVRLTAAGERLHPDAAHEVNSLYAVLLDERGDIITRRSHESGRQTLIGPVCTWAHELYDEQLAAAAAILYELEVRLDVRHVLAAGTLGAVDLDSDTRQIWPHTITATSDARLVQVSIGTFYNRGDFELFAMATSPCVHDGVRNELELTLRDEAGEAVANRWMSLSIGGPGVGYNDTSLRLEKRIAKQVRSFELRGRTEVRSVNRVGPLALTEAAGRARKPAAAVAAPAAATAPSPPPAPPPKPAAATRRAAAKPARPRRR